MKTKRPVLPLILLLITIGFIGYLIYAINSNGFSNLKKESDSISNLIKQELRITNHVGFSYKKNKYLHYLSVNINCDSNRIESDTLKLDSTIIGIINKVKTFSIDTILINYESDFKSNDMMTKNKLNTHIYKINQ